jgi:tRNA (guanine-N7-)-methyltransferase
MSENTAANRRPIPTTGRLATRMSAAEQAELHADLQPWLVTPDFIAVAKPLEIELGIGNGLALYARAAANPAQNFIGSEIYLNGLRTLLSHLKKNPLPNLRVYPQDGRTLFTNGLLKPASITRVLILFPDPWPKTSHHKRRLVQPELLTTLTKALAPQGELFVVTDWPSYAYHAISHIYQTKGLTIAPTHLAAADCKPSARLSERENDLIGPQLLTLAPEWWQPTKYQEKAAVAGRNPWFIKALKTG